MKPLPAARVPDLGSPDRLGFPAAGGWERAEALPSLLGAEDGRLLRAPTVVRIGCTAEGLCTRFECGGGVPPCTLVARGAPLWRESVVEVFLAGGRDDPERYLEVEINPAGAIFDALVSNPAGDRRSMTLLQEGVAGVAARVARPRRDLWTVEVFVPWSAIPRAAGSPWELRGNFFRIDRPVSGPPEFAAWSPTFASPADFHKPVRFGLLRRA